ncbi:hypothetical protein L1987_30675 [Smallanthus sonchifolius]|uniref:Uncharacterized protein n=1 Tax=Smallanthus sonchifolius TaxID=185202 RepID=A0ACB9I501_9ASTR|nr:hypothetical protein L1987_30675 [Smallanthus sonchifolius]
MICECLFRDAAGVGDALKMIPKILSSNTAKTAKGLPNNVRIPGRLSGTKGLSTSLVISNSLEGVAELGLRKIGEELAMKFLGRSGQKGFRWGWKGTNFYLKVDERCQKYTQFHPNFVPTADCVVVKCIIVLQTTKDVGGQLTSMIDWYNSCYDPIQAKCNETLTYDECKKLIILGS